MTYLEKDFGKLLKRNNKEMRTIFSAVGTNCYRVYDRNISELEVTVDIYGDFAVITDYREFPEKSFIEVIPNGGESQHIPGSEKLRAIAASNLYLQTEHIIFKKRKKLSNHEQHGKRSSEEIWAVVQEQGLSFKVELNRFTDTGIFLDHSITRNLVQQEATRRKVLNLFCYTGTFSVYAASAWATEVVSVDLSGNYLEWARENMASNGFKGEGFTYCKSDCRKYLEMAGGSGSEFDIIILDPPSFSNSGKMDKPFRIQKDYIEYIELCSRILTREGFILFSTNLSGFKLDKQKLGRFNIREITKDTIPPGFSSRFKPHRCWIIRK